MGFCSSYEEVRLFELSCLSHPLSTVLPGSFSQYVFNNADVNVDTLDGSNTLHAMGGIQCVTPSATGYTDQKIKSLEKNSDS